jgi:hypothetical protein
MLLAGLSAVFSGCALCCAPYDQNYPSTAGSWVRTNPTSGRVGSAFDPAGMAVAEIAGQRPNEGVDSTAPPAEAAPGEPTPVLPTPVEPGLPTLPEAQSVIPRRMGESYLPTQP